MLAAADGGPRGAGGRRAFSPLAARGALLTEARARRVGGEPGPEPLAMARLGALAREMAPAVPAAPCPAVRHPPPALAAAPAAAAAAAGKARPSGPGAAAHGWIRCTRS